MPQMMPLNWIMFYMIFNMMLIFMSIMIYYNFKYFKINFYKKSSMFKLNWKW